MVVGFGVKVYNKIVQVLDFVYVLIFNRRVFGKLRVERWFDGLGCFGKRMLVV